MWTQKIEYADAEVVLPPPVKKQVWDGEQFVPIMVYRTPSKLSRDQESWLRKIYGAPGIVQPGQYWDYASSMHGHGLMDEKIYMMFQLKWAGK